MHPVGQNPTLTLQRDLELIEHLDGATTLGEALAEAKRRTRKFARRQQRWFRRDPRITWFDAMAPDLVDAVARWWVNASV